MTLRTSSFTLAVLGMLVHESRALAAQTNITISMAAPDGTPAIHSPAVIGWNPSTPFVHAVAATGTAPLAYSATGLPTGLSVGGPRATNSSNCGQIKPPRRAAYGEWFRD